MRSNMLGTKDIPKSWLPGIPTSAPYRKQEPTTSQVEWSSLQSSNLKKSLEPRPPFTSRVILCSRNSKKRMVSCTIRLHWRKPQVSSRLAPLQMYILAELVTFILESISMCPASQRLNGPNWQPSMLKRTESFSFTRFLKKSKILGASFR